MASNSWARRCAEGGSWLRACIATREWRPRRRERQLAEGFAHRRVGVDGERDIFGARDFQRERA
jgi:hypothetical protein